MPVTMELSDINDARIYAESIVETIREPLIVLNGNLRVVSANSSFYKRFRVSEEETRGRHIYEVGNGQWNIPELREFLETIIPRNTEFHDYEVEHDFPSIGRRIMLLDGKRIEQEGGRRSLILLGIEDVTDRIQIRRALEESEEKFRGFIQNINSLIFRFNRRGEITFFNKFCEKIFGYDEKEVLGRQVAGTLLPERDGEGRDLVSLMNDVCSKPENYYIQETEGRKKDGGRIWFQWSAKAMDGEILVDGNDTTSLHEYRMMLEETRGLVESSPDIIARFDGDRCLVYANPLMTRFTGRSREEMIGKTVREIGLPEPAVKELESAFERAKVSRAKYLSGITLDDNAYHVQMVPEFGDNNAIRSLKLYAADITDKKAAEDKLRRSEYELQTLVDHSPDLIFRLDSRLRYVYVNPAYERITGLSKDRFIGRTNSQLGMPQKMAEFWRSVAQRAITDGREHTVEFAMSGFFGTRYFSAQIFPEFEKSGLVETVLVMARDITERKKAEEEIASLKK